MVLFVKISQNITLINVGLYEYTRGYLVSSPNISTQGNKKIRKFADFLFYRIFIIDLRHKAVKCLLYVTRYEPRCVCPSTGVSDVSRGSSAHPTTHTWC